MIVPRILGGLGNQMFQYALGRRLSLERGEPLRLDVSGLKRGGLRTLGLNHLALDPVYSSVEEVRALKSVVARFPENIVPRKWIPRSLRRDQPVSERHYKEVEGFRFDPQVLTAPSPLYLDGYWQSERYFDSIQDVIHADFRVRTPLSGKNAHVAQAIAECESVSLHVRRGDYASNPEIRAVHGLCSLEYYATAVTHMIGALRAPRFFVFSDDHSWTARHLELPGNSVFVDHNSAASDYEDLRLMSRCRHHVIANSSFSWWGAWLNARADKIVVAPRRWVVDTMWTCPDICPPDWVRL